VIHRLRKLIPEVSGYRVLIASTGLGVLVGSSVAVFEYIAIEIVFHSLLEMPLYVRAAGPAVGLLLTYLLLHVVGGNASPATSEHYVSEFHSRTPSFSFRRLVARMSGGVATIGFGGAVGLEGPSIYLGSALGHYIYRPLEKFLGRGATQQLLTAGAAAGVAAIFQAPATGMIFAMESPYRDDIAHRTILPSLVASASSFLTFVSMPFIHEASVVDFAVDRAVGTGELVGAVAVGVGAGFGGRAFAWFIRQAKALSKRVESVRLVIAGGAALAVLAVLSDEVFGEPLTLGPGITVFEWLDTTPTTRLLVALFFFRAAATLTTVGARGVGGLFIPLAVQGVLLGRIVGNGLDKIGLGNAEDIRLWPILGLAAFLAAGYRTPIAAVMFVAESTGGTAVVPALIAAAVSQLVAGQASVSLAQRQERLGGLESRLTLPIASAMETDVLAVPPDATISEFVFIHALGNRQPAVPVVDADNRYLGMCTIHDATSVPRADWETTVVTEILVPNGHQASPGWSIRDAVAAMGHNGSEILVVTDDSDRFVGIVRESEIVKLDEILMETETGEASA